MLCEAEFEQYLQKKQEATTSLHQETLSLHFVAGTPPGNVGAGGIPLPITSRETRAAGFRRGAGGATPQLVPAPSRSSHKTENASTREAFSVL